MIEQMASNRLWIYTALVGSLFGLAFSTYFKGTRIGLWLYSKFDRSVDYLVERFGWTWLNNLKMPGVKSILMLQRRLMSLRND